MRLLDIEWEDYQWFPKDVGAQCAAMEFFESLPFKTLNAIGVAIVEGDHPGRTGASISLQVERL